MRDMMSEDPEKKYRLKSTEMALLVFGAGLCIASDRITVDGESVGYMVREAAGFESDGGWRFFAGDEVDDYMNDPDCFGVHEVNAIANYDRAIIPHVNLPEGTELLRNEDGEMVEVDEEGEVKG